MIGLLGLPWAAAAIYAGWERQWWLAFVLVAVGAVLYVLLRPSLMVVHMQRNPLGTVMTLLITQGIAVSILFAIGMGLETILG